MIRLSLKEIKEGLTDMNVSAVARSTGLSTPTVDRLSKGIMLQYHPKTIATMSEYLLKRALNEQTRKRNC